MPGTRTLNVTTPDGSAARAGSDAMVRPGSVWAWTDAPHCAYGAVWTTRCPSVPRATGVVTDNTFTAIGAGAAAAAHAIARPPARPMDRIIVGCESRMVPRFCPAGPEA